MRGKKRICGLLMAMMLIVFVTSPAYAWTPSEDQVEEIGGAVDVQPVKTTVVGTEVEYNFRVSIQPIISSDGSQAADTFVIGVPAEATHTTITLVSTNSSADGPSPVEMQQVLNIQNVTQENFNNQTTSTIPLAGDFSADKTYVATSDNRELIEKMLGYTPVDGVKYYFMTSHQHGVVVMDVKTYLPENVAAENGKVCIMAQELAKAPSAETQAYRAIEASGAISMANYRPVQEGAEGTASWYVVNRDKIGEAVSNSNYVVGSYDQHGIYNTSMVPTQTGTVTEIGEDHNGLGIQVINYIQEFHLHLNMSVTYVATTEDLGDAAVLTYVKQVVTEQSKDKAPKEGSVSTESKDNKDGAKAEQNSSKGTKTSETTAPNTGDESQMMLYVLILLSSGGALGALHVAKIVRKK